MRIEAQLFRGGIKPERTLAIGCVLRCGMVPCFRNQLAHRSEMLAVKTRFTEWLDAGFPLMALLGSHAGWSLESKRAGASAIAMQFYGMHVLAVVK